MFLKIISSQGTRSAARTLARSSSYILNGTTAQTGGTNSRTFSSLIGGASSKNHELLKSPETFSKKLPEKRNLSSFAQDSSKSFAEEVAEDMQNAFLNVVKTQDSQLAPYISQVQEIEKGSDESIKKEQYKELWQNVNKNEDTKTQNRFLETLAKGKNLKDKIQFAKEMDDIGDSLVDSGFLETEDLKLQSVLSSLSEKDVKKVLNAYDKFDSAKQNPDFDDLLKNVIYNYIYLGSSYSSYWLEEPIKRLNSTKMKKDAPLPDRLDVVPPVDKTLEQFTTKLALLSSGFERTDAGKKFKQEITSLEQDENPTTSKIKESFSQMANYLTEDLKKQLSSQEYPKTTKEQDQQQRKRSYQINTIRMLNEEIENINNLENFYTGMAKIINIGKSTADDTFFDDDIEIAYSQTDSKNIARSDYSQLIPKNKEVLLSEVNGNIQQRLNEYIKSNDNNKSEVSEFYYEKLNKNWNNLTSRSDIVVSPSEMSSKLTEKLEFLGEYFNGNKSGEIIKSTIDTLKNDKSPTTEKIKENLEVLSGNLIDNLSSEINSKKMSSDKTEKEATNKQVKTSA